MVVSYLDKVISVFLFAVLNIDVSCLICLASGKDSVNLYSQSKHEQSTGICVTAKWTQISLALLNWY